MNLSKKWFLSTWFICFVFIFSIYIIPFVIGVILLIIQTITNKKFMKKYGQLEELDENIAKKQDEYDLQISFKKTEFELTIEEIEHKTKTTLHDNNKVINDSNKIIDDLKSEISLLKIELKKLHDDVVISHYEFSDYNGMTSEDCRSKLSLIDLDEQQLIKDDRATTLYSYNESKKIQNNKIKKIIRCFNSECENIISNISFKNIDSMRNKLTRSYETINKIFEDERISLTKELLELKLESLNLVYTYELKKEQEKEQQKAIKEQMIEEEKVRREIEKAKVKLDKDYSQFSNEINKLITYMQKTQNDVEKQLYIDKIRELEERLKGIEKEKEDVLEREANARAGFVYIISNIGSFGENIYKIGMTRRLEPMERIKELSSASVPFSFDVHAMIFSPDAPTLETSLHHYFSKHSVNKINPRKEFFKISIDDIEAYIKENYNSLVEFTKIPVAHEYRQSLQIAE